MLLLPVSRGIEVLLVNISQSMTARQHITTYNKNRSYFSRYKTQSPKNISIALENIVRVEKGKHSGWLPGDAQTLEIITDRGITLSFGALADREDVHREILVRAAQHAYKRKKRNVATTD